MLFAHDTEEGLAAAAGLVNTLDGGEEHLPNVEALNEFLRAWNWAGRHNRTESELHSVRALRPRLRELWYVSEDRAVEIVNELLQESKALPQLIKHDQLDYHIHAAPMDAPLATRMAVEAAMAFIDIIRGKEMGRLRICELPDCENVLVDLSKNRSKRFCESGCGNRAAVAAYRARKAATNPQKRP